MGTVLLCCAENGCWAFIPCNITLTSARWCKFTTPSSMEKYRIITHQTPQTPQDDAPTPLGKSPRPLRMISALESPWDLSEWVFPWEVPQTSQNNFPPVKSPRCIRMIFTTGKSPRTLRIKKVMPLSSTTPHPHSWALFHLMYSCLHDVFLLLLQTF